MKLENLVGRKVLCTQGYYGVTKGKEYTIIDFNGDYFSIIEDGGKKQTWSTSYLDSKEYFELLLKETQFKQGDKVLWSGGAMSEFKEGIFVTEYNGFFLIEYDGQIVYGKEIKPFVKSFKKGDWVKYKYNGETFFTQCKEDVENNNLSLVEDLELIKLMEKNK